MKCLSANNLIKLLSNKSITIYDDELTLYNIEFNEHSSNITNSKMKQELYNIYNDFLYTCENYHNIESFKYSTIDIKRILLAVATFCDNVVITLYSRFYQTTFMFLVNSVDIKRYIVSNYF